MIELTPKAPEIYNKYKFPDVRDTINVNMVPCANDLIAKGNVQKSVSERMPKWLKLSILYMCVCVMYYIKPIIRVQQRTQYQTIWKKRIQASWIRINSRWLSFRKGTIYHRWWYGIRKYDFRIDPVTPSPGSTTDLTPIQNPFSVLITFVQKIRFILVYPSLRRIIIDRTVQRQWFDRHYTCRNRRSSHTLR